MSCACKLEPLQLNWFRVAMWLYNSLIKSSSYTVKKVLHADMPLSTRYNDCWSAHVLSAMDGLTQLYFFKQKLQNCKPIDLSSRFVVDLRERHLEFWTLYPDTHPTEHTCTTANTLLITNGVLFLQKGLWSLIRLTSFPNTCFSTCLVKSFAVQLVSDFVFTPLMACYIGQGEIANSLLRS